MPCNADFTRNKRFLAVTYSCAAVGIGVGAMMAAPASLAVVAASGIAGGVVSGIAVPALGYGGSITLATFSDRFRQKFYPNDNPAKLREIPIFMVLLALNSYAALFTKPWRAAKDAWKKIFTSKKGDASQPVSPVDTSAPSLTDASAQTEFNKESAPAAPKAEAAPAASQEIAPPKKAA